MSYVANVLGASGYSGAELLRLIIGHPALEVGALGAGSRAGEPLGVVHPHLAGWDRTLVPAEEAAAAPADVLFSCLPSGELGKLLPQVAAPVVIDLSDEHRADPGWVYGLTEWARPELATGGVPRVANPGCYPTAILLALLPFVEAGAVEPPVVVDAISGVSGAGRRLEDRLLFASVAGSVGAYGPVPHRHVAEVERALSRRGFEAAVSFTPHLAPLERGLVATVRARAAASLDEDGAAGILRRAYADEPFVVPAGTWPQSKAVAGSNRALVHARTDPRAGWLVATCAIDNLGKGAAGQAVQNANLVLGLDEATGLGGTPLWP